jgi:hypothetical protein
MINFACTMPEDRLLARRFSMASIEPTLRSTEIQQYFKLLAHQRHRLACLAANARTLAREEAPMLAPPIFERQIALTFLRRERCIDFVEAVNRNVRGANDELE